MAFIVKAYGGAGGSLTAYHDNLKTASEQVKAIDTVYSPELLFEDQDGTLYKIVSWMKVSK